MMQLVDRLLNRFTMYRLTLYYLAALLALALGLSFFGVVPGGPVAILSTTAILLAACYLANLAFARLWRVRSNPESSLITALILALISGPVSVFADPAHAAVIALSGVVAVASKYLLAFRRQHVLNPAALGAVFSGLAFGTFATWWVGNVALLPLVVIGGFLLIRKIEPVQVSRDVPARFHRVPGGAVVRAGSHGGHDAPEPRLCFPPDGRGLLRRRHADRAHDLAQAFPSAGSLRGDRRLSLPAAPLAVRPEPHPGRGASHRQSLLVPREPEPQAEARPEGPPRRGDRDHELRVPAGRPASSAGAVHGMEPAPAEERQPGHAPLLQPRFLSHGAGPHDRRAFPRHASRYKEALGCMPVGQTILAGELGGDFTLPRDTSVPLAFIAVASALRRSAA